jgi:hypothetical protein
MGRLALAALAAFLLSFSPAFALTDTDFHRWYREALPQVEQGQFPRLRDMERYRVLIVGGFLGEALKDSFVDTRRDLIRMGIAPHKIAVLRPNSTQPIEENAAVLRDQFGEFATAGEGEPIVIFGHSKGAAESLLALLGASPSLRQRIVGGLFVQGAFLGSPLADLFTGGGHPVDSGMVSPYRELLRAVLALDPASRIRELEGYLGFPIGAGLYSLRVNDAAGLWDKALHANPDGIAELDEKVFYVRTFLPPQEVRTTLRVPAEYLSAYYGPNDGVVPLRSQTIGGFGRLLGTLRADHISLTKGNLPPGVERTRAAAFNVAIARSIQQLAAELPSGDRR